MLTENQVKRWYDDWHAQHGSDAWRVSAAYSTFLDHLRVRPGGQLLDVGCGTGHLLQEANARGLDTWGVDISEEGVKIARQTSPNSHISLGQGENLDLDDKTFDYVTCIGSLEHFLDIEKGLQEITRVCKDGGLICIVVPNVNFLPWKFLWNKGTKQRNINEKLLSLNHWKQTLARHQMQIRSIHQDRWFTSRRWFLGSPHPFRLIKRLLVALGLACLPLPLTYQFIFVLEKRRSHS